MNYDKRIVNLIEGLGQYHAQKMEADFSQEDHVTIHLNDKVEMAIHGK